MDASLSGTVAVVLAGGYGTRVRHLLPGVPKPMAPVAGRPFLEWILHYLRHQGIARVIISTGYLAGVVSAHFQQRTIPGIAVTCVAEAEPLGTGGGFLRAARACGEKPEDWLLLNGDTLAFADLKAMAGCLNAPGAQGVLLARRVPDAARYGTLTVGPGGDLLGFEEKRAGEGIINAGVYWLRPSLLGQFPRGPVISLESEVFPAWVASRLALKVHLTSAPFLDIGTPETLAQAETFVQQNLGQFGLS